MPSRRATGSSVRSAPVAWPTVYLAEDLKHHRRIALKVLKPELAAILGAERFLKEIEVTANLQHPNILPLYDSGEAAGFLYYVMPFIEGESLRQRLTREKQLPLAEAARITADRERARLRPPPRSPISRPCVTRHARHWQASRPRPTSAPRRPAWSIPESGGAAAARPAARGADALHHQPPPRRQQCEPRCPTVVGSKAPVPLPRSHSPS